MNLGLHQRDVSVDLGSRASRFLDPAALAGGAAGVDRGHRPRLDRPGHPRRRLHEPAVPLGDRRERRAELACAEQAAPHGDRRAATRWSSTRTARPSRCGYSTGASSTRDPETFGEYQLSYRSGDILSPQIAATEPLVDRARGVRAPDSHGRDLRRSRARAPGRDAGRGGRVLARRTAAIRARSPPTRGRF